MGSACGGIAAGSLWTAQGAYFARNAELFAEASQREQRAGKLLKVMTKEESTGLLSSIFAVLYLGFEVLMKLLAVLPEGQQVSSEAGHQLLLLLVMAAVPVITRFMAAFLCGCNSSGCT